MEAHRIDCKYSNAARRSLCAFKIHNRHQTQALVAYLLQIIRSDTKINVNKLCQKGEQIQPSLFSCRFMKATREPLNYTKFLSEDFRVCINTHGWLQISAAIASVLRFAITNSIMPNELHGHITHWIDEHLKRWSTRLLSWFAFQAWWVTRVTRKA